jgi:hypothetical protein
MLWHIVLANNSTTLTNNSRISFVRHDVVVVVVIYNIYIFYIIVKSLSRFTIHKYYSSLFNTSKIYEVIYIINFKNILQKSRLTICRQFTSKIL